MKPVLHCIPLKQGKLKQFQDFVKQTFENKKKDWKDMLKRYDIDCVSVWHRSIENREFVFVYHEVGPTFEEKLSGWDQSEHPFDQWFNEQIMSVYDIEDVSAMQDPHLLVDLR